MLGDANYSSINKSGLNTFKSFFLHNLIHMLTFVMQNSLKYFKMKRYKLFFLKKNKSLVGVSVEVRRFSLASCFRLFCSDLPYFIVNYNFLYHAKQRIECKSNEQ